ncbi:MULTISPECIES: 3-hydroxybutyrate dehydrogenase [Bacillaceae]|mgnify:CR=1 FL=1|jgi:3-hydroxybutyrate dehydrogenase|uniref:3-hydroxybutyrate dehydrogenase n=1 Tax=Bacillaceae TaxID=186817 RepID=UPI000C341874|nr:MULTISPECIES: 3-hydroxybutyrate dehydrogenase [Bacillaceae]MBL3641768.1 3-hydroxybutyrate dehydrogenase [Bacillus sp. RHFB]TDL88710.1 3-hydroxybutyrate dehydrogenase [Vibrio vulnificus]MCM3169413.1 3-hydroxybutyrate dehydrogenase [Peribacillus frigoritolerans]MCT4479087.1 3-hydroxybutyrate dehydrogenase [Peribacillus frigoritolerans]MEB2629352.1 3-hydroxybutyrate dehydrogenase [Peribacillus frigoritolerans]
MVENKVVIITGSARGIGFEIGKHFAESGAKVVLSDINEESVKDAAESLKKLGFDSIGIKADVTKEEDIVNMVKEAKETYGSVDIVINNAGLQHVSPIEDFPTAKYELMIKIMLTAPFILTKAVFPIMKEQGFGRIINVSSINGVIGFAGKAAYNSAKHGVIGLTKVAALEGAEHGITVNALCPGYVDTPLVRGQMADLAKTRNVPIEDVLAEVLLPLVPQKRLLDVSEIADYALFLASDKAKSVTGQAVVIDGGYTAQ